MKKLLAVLFIISVLSLTSCHVSKSESDPLRSKVAETFPTNEEGIISKADMKALILKYANIGYDVRIDDNQLTLDAEDGRKVYRVMFCDDLNVHKYTIDATTGEILSEMVKSIDSYYG